jgi:hypothetical protein
MNDAVTAKLLNEARLPLAMGISQEPPLPGGIAPCLLCGKPFLMGVFLIGEEPDQLCPECMETYKDTAKVVCRTCKVTICRLVPRILDNGYYIRPRAVLHSDACNVCRPGLRASSITEISDWNKHHRTRKIIVGAGSGVRDT